MNKPEIVWRDPNQLIPYVKNARKHSDEQINEIAGLITAFGFDQPIVVDASGVIIKGHGRREASLRLGLPEVPVIVSTLDEYQAMASRMADNKVAEKATWDMDLLKFDIGTLALRDFDMKLTSMSEADITGILKEETADTLFNDNRKENPKEREEKWENSDIRQIVLVCDPETFESVMTSVNTLMTEFAVESNIEVLQELITFYETNRVKDDEPGSHIDVSDDSEGDGLHADD